MTSTSIRRRLVILLLGSLALVWSAMLVFAYAELRHEVDELADARLQQSARTLQLLDLRRLHALSDQQLGDDEHERDRDRLDEEEMRYLEFQVWGNDGRLLARTPGAPRVGFAAGQGYASHPGGWRSFTVRNPARDYQVQVFDTTGSRGHIVNKLAWRMAQSLLLMLPVLALMIWIAVGRGLLPLAAMSRAIGARSAGNLQPLDLHRVPHEVQPVVDSLNKLLARLSESIDRERSFTADAAHELRTPLAAIKIQAEVALAAESDEQRRQAIMQVIAGVQRTTRLVQQLLLLARLDHAVDADLQTTDLAQLAVDSAARHADDAARKAIELEVDAPHPCRVRGNSTALSIMIDNLLDNAVKYGRSGGHVWLRVGQENALPVLTVEDDGPGVPAEFRDRLADRFFRVAGSGAEGSGLGLSIVDRVARRYGGVLDFGEGRNGSGLRVSVRFPV